MGSLMCTEPVTNLFEYSLNERIVQSVFVIDVPTRMTFSKRAAPYWSGVMFLGCVKRKMALSAAEMAWSCADLISR